MRYATSLLVILLAASTISAQAVPKSVQVGTFTLGGSDQSGTVFTWTLEAPAITTTPICFGGVTWIVDGISHTYLADALDPQCTLPLTAPPSLNHFLVMGCDQFTPGCVAVNPYLPSCYKGCKNISIQLLSLDGKAFSFALLNGRNFKTYGVNTSSMSPQPGHLYLTPGQMAPLVLYRDPAGK